MNSEKKKHILFVTYGGGHSKLCLPVIREFLKDERYTVTVFALTLAIPFYRNQSINIVTYVNFLHLFDEKLVNFYGRKLLDKNHNPNMGLEKHESIVYLGINYLDLVEQNGDVIAGDLYQKRHRHSFLPLNAFKKILREIKPDLVVNANSPKSESAAVIEANKIGVPTVSINDLFFENLFSKTQANFVFVMSDFVKNQALRKVTSAQRVVVTGSPVFDELLKKRNNLVVEQPKGIDRKKRLLFLDQPSYFNPELNGHFVRDSKEVEASLLMFSRFCDELDLEFCVRFHPSQNIDSKLLDKFEGLIIEDEHELTQVLMNIDIAVSFASTALFEAAALGVPSIQMKFYKGDSNVPIYKLGMAEGVENVASLFSVIKRISLFSKIELDAYKAVLGERADDFFPEGKSASDNIVNELIKIVET